ncbi:FK506 suppressor Sfk1 [Daldinia childiae]|uniref:FK506 suppressor Sfk1 n=1 Tax=Daldinia childiae TaxID=326645 RepID=UPI0014478B83|nr:FK506 suppressor Sfk1 [Daldinia childiae]KAF3065258.1 FK506 suppressor Sfk1 [Daldinia childiae]
MRFLSYWLTLSQRNLSVENRQHRVLRISFWVKLIFVVVELGLAIAFGVINFRGNHNTSAIIEWVIAFVFSFYVFSFYIDLYPAITTRNNPHPIGDPTRRMEETYYATHPSVLPGDRHTQDSQRTLTDSHGHQHKVRTDQRDF